MKEYKYNGDLKEDIRKSKHKFSIKIFLLYFLCTLIGVTLASLIYVLMSHTISVGLIIGLVIVNTGLDISKTIKETKEKSRKKISKICQLYEQINLNYSDRELSVARMKECISIQKSEKIIKNQNTNNISLTDEEKIVTYFYLLDPQEQIQVLRQVKDEVKKWDSTIYLLEEEDIKNENIEIPVERTLRLKK